MENYEVLGSYASSEHASYFVRYLLIQGRGGWVGNGLVEPLLCKPKGRGFD
jgi:hypothetical protein